MVVISTAWASKPYAIASLLFNSMYNSIPMACHYMGEMELRRQAFFHQQDADHHHHLNYVILRAGGLNSDERYAQKYPEAVQQGLTYQQGDTFTFLGPAGRPGMSRTQLAHAVATAVDVQGRYTVEVTGSGTVGLDDASVYETTLKQDGADVTEISPSNEEIMRIHTQAVSELRATLVALSLGGIALIIGFGWTQGLLSLFVVDAVVLYVWSQFFANRQI